MIRRAPSMTGEVALTAQLCARLNSRARRPGGTFCSSRERSPTKGTLAGRSSASGIDAERLRVVGARTVSVQVTSIVRASDRSLQVK